MQFRSNEINNIVNAGGINELVKISEYKHQVQIENIVRIIASYNEYTKNSPITNGVFVTGPSSSGKTTTAKLIAKELEKKFRQNKFDFEDYLVQMENLKKMGNLDSLIGMIPGMNTGALKDAKVDEGAMRRTEAIILSMTEKDRNKPDSINGSRRKRIAKGSGTSVEEVNRLMKQYEQMNKMFKQLTGGSKKGKKRMKMPFQF